MKDRIHSDEVKGMQKAHDDMLILLQYVAREVEPNYASNGSPNQKVLAIIYQSVGCALAHFVTQEDDPMPLVEAMQLAGGATPLVQDALEKNIKFFKEK